MTSGLVCAHLSLSSSRSRSNRNQISRVRWTYLRYVAKRILLAAPAPKKVLLTVCERERAARVSSRRSALVDAGRVAVSTRRGGHGRRQQGSGSRSRRRRLLCGFGDLERERARVHSRVRVAAASQAGVLAELLVRSCACPLRAAGRWECLALRRSRQLWERWARMYAARRAAAHRGDPRADRQRSPGSHAVAGRRIAVAQALAECRSDDGWRRRSSFRFMRASGIDFEVTRTWSLYIADKRVRHLGYDGFGGWNILQAAMRSACSSSTWPRSACGCRLRVTWARGTISTTSGEPTIWSSSAGTTVSPSSPDPLGAYCLGRSAKVDAVEVDSARVSRSLRPHDMATGPVPVADRLFLDRMRAGSLDGWQLDRARLMRCWPMGARCVRSVTFSSRVRRRACLWRRRRSCVSWKPEQKPEGRRPRAPRRMRSPGPRRASGEHLRTATLPPGGHPPRGGASG